MIEFTHITPAMYSWRLALTTSLAVSRVSSWLIDYHYRFYGKPATVSGPNDPLLAQQPQEDHGPSMLTINTSVHLVATSGDKLLSVRYFAPRSASFTLIS